MLIKCKNLMNVATDRNVMGLSIFKDESLLMKKYSVGLGRGSGFFIGNLGGGPRQSKQEC
jgi:uncharacterized spore protein YtfJ